MSSYGRQHLGGLTEAEVRAEIVKRAGDAILRRYPDIQDCVIPTVVEEVLNATVEAEADNVMRAYMTLIGWR
jgi:hypothetical protein